MKTHVLAAFALWLCVHANAQSELTKVGNLQNENSTTSLSGLAVGDVFDDNEAGTCLKYEVVDVSDPSRPMAKIVGVSDADKGKSEISIKIVNRFPHGADLFTVQRIAPKAFSYARNLATVTCSASMPLQIEENTFHVSAYAHAMLVVPKTEGTMSVYAHATGWRHFLRKSNTAGLLLGDLSGNGQLDTNDIALLIRHYRKSEPYRELHDMDGNGKIDTNDIALSIRIFKMLK
ncbi:MAG: hypothetical protein PUH24_06905 [Prevotellaceae bacterium]|nr:hypothetical protein [Prevotella sp.]MDD7257977.1 hypothetical protein [Prevotellaceae bacterium]MDY6131461.1 hypothetical protein [Prevotella sp.]